MQYKLDQICKQRSPKSELMKDLRRKLPDIDYALRDSSSLNSTILIDGEKPSDDMTPAWSKEMEIAEELEELYEPMQTQDACDRYLNENQAELIKYPTGVVKTDSNKKWGLLYSRDETVIACLPSLTNLLVINSDKRIRDPN